MAAIKVLKRCKDFRICGLCPAWMTCFILLAFIGVSFASDEPQSSFSGLYKSDAIDLDKDGLYDSMDVAVGANAIASGYYEVTGDLQDQNGSETHLASNRTYLTLGADTLILRFYGLCHPGAFYLRNLTLRDDSGRILEHLDEAYTTPKYTILDPTPEIAKLTGDYKDHATDANGDGRYEDLTIDVGVYLFSPGQYTLTGYLYDQNGSDVAWSIDSRDLDAGETLMHLRFDGGTIREHEANGPYRLGNLFLSGRNWTIDEFAKNAYNTSAYKFVDFAEPLRPMYEKYISGVGKGELALTVIIKQKVPVRSGAFSFDISGINIPPISTPLAVKSSKLGYSYNLTGIYMPSKPNNFTVTASSVKNLNIGLKKLQGSYENSSMIWKGKYTRIWITTQAEADKNGTATAMSDLLSPGNYDAKIFGDAAKNTSEVDLTMTLEKKLMIDGRFSLAINTSGFPAGDYAMIARASNGSFCMDEMAVEGLSMED